MEGTTHKWDISGSYHLSGEQLRVLAVLGFCLLGTLWLEFVFRTVCTAAGVCFSI